MPRITVDVSPEQHRRFTDAKLARGMKKLGTLMTLATERLLELEQTHKPKEKVIQSEHSKPVTPSLAAHVPTDADPELQDAVADLIRIWDSGDAGFIGAIRNNLREFARAADAINQGPAYEGSANAATGGPDFQRRVEKLLERADDLDAQAERDTPKAATPRRGRRGVVPMEERDPRKTGSGGKH